MLFIKRLVNGPRLGIYQSLDNNGYLKNLDGTPSVYRSTIGAMFSASVGAILANPFYLVKIQLQSQAAQEIAVGHQHGHTSMSHAFRTINREKGILGFSQGVGSSIFRAIAISPAQLVTFNYLKHHFEVNEILVTHHFCRLVLMASVSGIVAVTLSTPIDVVTTRMFNQCGFEKKYKNSFDCLIKTVSTEGFSALYKGYGPAFLRLVPHSTIVLTVWDYFRFLYLKFQS